MGAPAAINLYPGLLDYCAPVISEVGRSPVAALESSAVATGSFVATLLPEYGGRSIVAIGAPVYRLGAKLETLRQRRAAATGSVAFSPLPSTIASLASPIRSQRLSRSIA